MNIYSECADYKVTKLDENEYRLQKTENMWYDVDLDARVVTCTLTDSPLPHSLYAYVKFTDIGRRIYTATAKCAPEDEFDIHFGIKLAKARALKKYYKARTAVCDKIKRLIKEDYYKAVNEMASSISKQMDYNDFLLNVR